MRIKRYQNDKGSFRCFAVNNLFVSRKGMAKIAESYSGVNIIRWPRFHDDELFCEFELNGKKFEIIEPYGDSSTYDVVAPEDNLKEMEAIANHFENSKAIRGGDFGHNLFFFINWVIGSAVIMGLIFGIWQGIKWMGI